MVTNFTKKITLTVTLLSTLLFITPGCKNDKLKVDVSQITVDVKFQRFDSDLMEIDTTQMQAEFNRLEQKYPEFFPSYYSQIVSLGNFDDSMAPENLKYFLKFGATRDLFGVIKNKFKDVGPYNNQIKEAFKYYKYYFAADTLPDVIYFPGILKYGCIYFGNQVAVGLDMYLHTDYPYHKIPTLTNYLVVKMRPEYIARNVVNTMGNYRFEKYNTGSRFIDHMIFEGKLAYFMDAMMPGAPDSIKMALTTANLKWCKDNEWQIWKHMVDPKLKILYSTDTDLISRYFEEGPFTNAAGIPNVDELSSPRFAVWTGRQIVRKYMDNNPGITLEQLMREADNDKILKESKYKP